jgi:hypothetical protein
VMMRVSECHTNGERIRDEVYSSADPLSVDISSGY